LATPTAVQPTTGPATAPTMCLLHGDFHTMGQDCWSVTIDFHFDHQDVPEQEARNCYLAAVERKMLDNLVRSSR
jgi:hypothetical protein